ncbi:MAG: hypothetical protein MSH32_03735 [Lachnospiraceae bacterium]|nr:hypothetical protein [Lachnospiraceae bacterium]
MANESDYRKLKESIIFKQKNIDKLLKRFSKNVEEISRMKSGSMAIINQITTISKQRIYTPKKAEDFLYSVSLSDTALNKINEKLKEKYIF